MCVGCWGVGWGRGMLYLCPQEQTCTQLAIAESAKKRTEDASHCEDLLRTAWGKLGAQRYCQATRQPGKQKAHRKAREQQRPQEQAKRQRGGEGPPAVGELRRVELKGSSSRCKLTERR